MLIYNEFVREFYLFFIQFNQISFLKSLLISYEKTIIKQTLNSVPKIEYNSFHISIFSHYYNLIKLNKTQRVIFYYKIIYHVFLRFFSSFFILMNYFYIILLGRYIGRVFIFHYNRYGTTMVG